MIELKGIRAVGCKIYSGRIYGLMDAAGAVGELSGLIAGALTDAHGEVRINGFDLKKEEQKAKQYLSYLPAAAPLWDELTLREVLSFVADVRGLSYERALRLTEELTEALDLTKLCDKTAKALSPYERTRASLAIALLSSPEYLILDEPTAGLDRWEADKLCELLRRVAEDRTLIIATRDANLVGALCDTLLLFDRDSVIVHAPMDEWKSEIGDELLLACELPRKDLTLTALFSALCAKNNLKNADTSAKKRSKLIPDAAERDGDYELIDTGRRGED